VVAGAGEREDFRIVGGAPGCSFAVFNSRISEQSKVRLSVLGVNKGISPLVRVIGPADKFNSYSFADTLGCCLVPCWRTIWQ
jgi:hypothetical protein